MVLLLVFDAFSLSARVAADLVPAPLAYGAQCWSTVELRNMGAGPVRLRLEVAGEESAEGWVLVRGEGVAVEGKTECVVGWGSG